MMGLLMYTLPYREFGFLPLKKPHPPIYPFTLAVNRVNPGELDPFHYTLLDETVGQILQAPYHHDTFENLARQRAAELAAFDGTTYLMWSGGIDSTTALAAIFDVWSQKEIDEKLVLLTSHHAYQEYPEAWDFTKGLRRVNAFSVDFEKLIEDGGRLLTGEHGDQVFGSEVGEAVYRLFGEDALWYPYERVMPHVYDWRGIDGKAFVEHYRDTTSSSLYPIKTAFDWVWWYNFTNKWQWVKYRLVSVRRWRNPRNIVDGTVHFFDTVSFQRWSMDSPEGKILKTWDSYKWAAKEFVMKILHDEDFRYHKKLPSQLNIWNTLEMVSAVGTDFKPMNAREVRRYLRR